MCSVITVNQDWKVGGRKHSGAVVSPQPYAVEEKRPPSRQKDFSSSAFMEHTRSYRTKVLFVALTRGFPIPSAFVILMNRSRFLGFSCNLRVSHVGGRSGIRLSTLVRPLPLSSEMRRIARRGRETRRKRAAWANDVRPNMVIRRNRI